ncbi:MAG TPA: hypothetical protein VME69_15690 [Methylocella sp.]|nr:hypothetical protein [Methylocella sp.]
MGGPVEASLQRLEAKLDLAIRDFANLKAGLAGLALPGAQVEILLAGTNSRLDLVDERLARIAEKLDLIRRDLQIYPLEERVPS